MAYSRIEIAEYGKVIGKSPTTLWRWVREGCNLRDPKSVREWVMRNEIRQTPIERARRRRRDNERAAQRPPWNGSSIRKKKRTGDYRRRSPAATRSRSRRRRNSGSNVRKP